MWGEAGPEDPWECYPLGAIWKAQTSGGPLVGGEDSCLSDEAAHSSLVDGMAERQTRAQHRPVSV